LQRRRRGLAARAGQIALRGQHVTALDARQGLALPDKSPSSTRMRVTTPA
jgi:hypothetical protein